MLKRRAGKRSDGQVSHYNTLSQVQRIGRETVTDLGGQESGVWRIFGRDGDDPIAVSGWSRFLLSLNFPVNILVRQHLPGLRRLKDDLLEARPERMGPGTAAGVVGDSLLEMLDDLEVNGRVVDREIYLMTKAERALDVPVMLNAGAFSFDLQTGEGLRQLYLASMSARSVSSLHLEDLDAMAPCPLRVHGKRVEWEDGRCGAYFELVSWPRRISAMFLERLFALGIELDLSLYIRPLAHAEALSFLALHKMRFESRRLQLVVKGKLVPPEVEGAISDVDVLQDQIARNQGGLFDVAMSIGIYAGSPEELDEKIRQVNVYFEASQARVRLLRMRQDRGFASVSPRFQTPAAMLSRTDLGTIERFFPFSPPIMDTGQGTFFALDSRSRGPIIFDRFSDRMKRPNGHMVVLAPSGSGKSFAMKTLVIREATRGIPVYLVDPEGEYSFVAQQLGGVVFHPGREGFGVNPFRLRYKAADQLALQVGNLACLLDMMVSSSGLLSRVETVIDDTLTAFYAEELLDYREGVRRVQDIERGVSLGEGGIFSYFDFLRRSNLRGAEELADRLAPFVTGSYRYIFSSDDGDRVAGVSVDESPCTVFSLAGVPDDMKPIVTMICTQTLWAMAMSDTLRRIMLVDECWSVLQTASGSKALRTMAKRGRKYQLSLVTITQDIQDFLSVDEGRGQEGAAGLALMQNSADKLLLRQPPNTADLLLNVEGLNQSQIDWLIRCRIGEGLLLTSGGNHQVQVVATPEEYEMIENRIWRTELDDRDEREEAQFMDELRRSGYLYGEEVAVEAV